MDRPSIQSNPVTISVVAICYNEERDLPGFFACLLPWVDEIILVDGGSTDSTLNLAARAGDNVRVVNASLDNPDGFAGLRNAGVKAATSDWVMNMDIDERVTPTLKNEILLSISNTHLNAFRYRRCNYFLHRPMKAGGWDSWNNPQLARRTKHRYQGKVHERSIVEGGEGAIGQLRQPMLHLNDDGYVERMRKSMQYSQMEADKLIEANKKVTALDLLLRVPFEFIKNYLLKRGFLDGVPGLISAMHAGCAVFRVHALTWDRTHTISREKLEREIQQQWESIDTDA